MNSTVRILLVTMAVGMMLSASTCRPASNGDDKIRTVTSAENALDLALNDSLRISLGQCTGCADGWKVLFADSNVSVRDAGYIPDCNDCVGGSGNALYMVKARRTGEAKIGFGYFDDTVVFRIQVK